MPSNFNLPLTALTVTFTVAVTVVDIEIARHSYCPASCSCTRRKRSVLELKALTLEKRRRCFMPTLRHKTWAAFPSIPHRISPGLPIIRVCED